VNRRPLIPAALVATLAVAAAAQTRGVLVLAVGEGELVRLSAPAATVFVANPEIADVQIAGPQSVFLFGASTGRTSFFALDADGAPIAEREVRVEHDLSGVRRILASRFPDRRIEVTSAPNSLMVSGAVETPEEADAIALTVQGALGEGETLINRLTVATPVQVNLRVRVSEVSRNIDERLGFNWSALFNIGDFAFGVATGRGLLATSAMLMGDGERFGSILGGYADDNRVNVNVILDALDREGLARTLAEPNLTALSGETASFTAGGEFPIPVAQDGDRTTIEFKPFGVILDFTPTVLSADRISLRVRPEVSDLTDLGAIRIDDFEIPALTVRRVDTTVELASGQSLVIGGLLQQTSRDAIDKVPGLGDIPVLGSLFTSTRYQNSETELIVTVTPYVVRAVSPDRLSNPLGPRAAGRSFEALLGGRAAGGAPARLNGPVGFVY
jgi:pilus assembly protein CpaC